MECKTGVPTSKHISQYYHLAITNIGILYHNDGKMVPGLSDRNDWCVDNEVTMKWGGVQIKKDSHEDSPWLHHLAVESII